MSVYGYPLIVAILFIGSVGAPLPLSFALVLLGALSAGHGGPDLLLLMLSGTAASVMGDLADYTVGRAGGARLLRWLYRRDRRLIGPPLVRANRLLRRHGGVVIFLSRFLITAVASPVSLLVGISRLKVSRFLIWDVAGEAIFVAGNLLIGRFLGGSLEEQGDLAPLFWILGVASIALPLAYRLGRHLWQSHPWGRGKAGPAVGTARGVFVGAGEDAADSVAPLAR